VVLHAPTYGTRRTLVGAIAMDGRKTLQVLKKGLRIETWLKFVETHLVPILRKGDIVVMDNLRIHHNKLGIKSIEAAGATVLFQPAYSPEFNAIEFAWSWVKYDLRRAANRDVDRLVSSALQRWDQVSPQLCRGWMSGCGYAVGPLGQPS
jgi:transposase